MEFLRSDCNACSDNDLVLPVFFFSIYKKYTHKPDPVVVDQYVEDFNDFKKSYEQDIKKDSATRTTKDTQYILPMFEQNWLINKDSVNMGERDLDNMLFEVKENKSTLMHLLVEEDYTKDQRRDVVYSLENLQSLEELIIDIKTEKTSSRSTLNTQFHNLRVRYISTFGMYASFYKEYHGLDN
ncbi:hypothetical protein SAMN05421743_108167 [Thalassobacillus cyri]|uniref:Uncharacterized protein n=1 Tax=Thalassobacillus cyri TaxID=571932 RepID=A0A1H4E7V9_9BACI|nr:hypothetical protein [Thalassobacillus cyri]SEA80889.1 hypothetical protein SAMN05421743_108167 [Thalassobacillus cyri]